MPYQLFLHARAVDQLFPMRSQRRRLLMEFFERLARDPFLKGELNTKDHLNREAEVKLVAGRFVTYYADHATKEVQILSIEPV